MSRLKSLLRVSGPSTCNTQQIPVQACKAVPQHMHTTQQPLLRVAHPNPCNTQHAALDKAFEERASTSEPLSDPEMQARRQRVLVLLTAHPSVRYALVTDTESDPEAVVLALAIRGQATCEFCIPRDKYDGFLLLDLLNRYGGTIH